MQQADRFRKSFERVRDQVRRVVVGQEEVVESVLVGLAANGHVLLEGMPGLGKTLLVRTLARALSLDFSRIQFTPDMMPSDVTGTNVLNEARAFEFRRGPVFANIVLADEINRATPKTQSAMLEAMQERSVTIGGKRYSLPDPFLVMATQNPVEQEGTYPLPEAQLDRFFFKVLVHFPSKAELAEVVTRTTGTVHDDAEPTLTAQEILELREIVRAVPIAPNILDYALTLVLATHPDNQNSAPVAKQYCRYGASPRGAQSLVTAGKVYALLAGRFNVAKDDVRKALWPVLRHRIHLNFEAEADGKDADRVLKDVLAHVEATDLDPIRA